jgi:hypothetical protein
MDWTNYTGAVNDVNKCSRNQLIVLDRPENLERLQAFQDMLAVELSLPMADPVFGLEMELPLRFTLLSIGNAPVITDVFKQEFEANLSPLVEQLRAVFPVKITFQVCQ